MTLGKSSNPALWPAGFFTKPTVTNIQVDIATACNQKASTPSHANGPLLKKKISWLGNSSSRATIVNTAYERGNRRGLFLSMNPATARLTKTGTNGTKRLRLLAQFSQCGALLSFSFILTTGERTAGSFHLK